MAILRCTTSLLLSVLSSLVSYQHTSAFSQLGLHGIGAGSWQGRGCGNGAESLRALKPLGIGGRGGGHVLPLQRTGPLLVPAAESNSPWGREGAGAIAPSLRIRWRGGRTPLLSASSAEGSGDSREAASDSEGGDVPVRPEWLPDFVPTWVCARLHPVLQLAIMLALYAFHLLVLSKNSWNFPTQLIPNDKGAFQSIGLDSVAGLVVVGGILVMRKLAGVSPVPKLLTSDNPPWRVPRDARRVLGGTTAYLLLAYIASGYGAVFCEQVLLLLSVYNVPLTIPTMRAWKVLLGHLMWVYMGVRILGTKHRPFFPPKGTWLRWRTKSNWVWWVVGSYFVSALLFNCADLVNQFLLPSTIFDEESVVSKLVNPENKDLLAMAVGAVGPCISAPIFEEVLYRGFLLPALAVMMPLQWAIPTSSILFAVHHLNVGGILPLSILGLAWAIIYTQSRNLLVTILIHALWNSRVFLGSFNTLCIPLPFF